MKCNEVHDYMGDAIDRGLPRNILEEFLSHLHLCPPCRNEYEIETLARKIVRSKIALIPTPTDVYRSIVTSLEQESESGPARESWMERLFAGKILAPVLTAGLAIVAFFLFFNQPDPAGSEFTHNASNDVINQSLKNFTLVQSGELKPSMISCYPEVMVGYFHENGLRFAVSIPSMDSCDWYGAISNEYSGIKLAHVIYKRGEDLIYVYQVGKEEALRGSVLDLPAPAKKALAETGWYTDPGHPDCNVVLWTADEALCAAVSSMKKDRLLALLTTK